MAEVIWTEQSLEDIQQIADFIAKDSLVYAQWQVERFLTIEQQLSEHPYSGRKVPEINDDTIREVIVGMYRMIYYVNSSDKVSILTVHHSNRLLSNNPWISMGE